MQPIFHRLQVLLFVILFPVFVFGQLKDGTVKIRLIESNTQQAVEFASVSIISTKDSTVIKNMMSNKTGSAEFTGVAHGEYRLLISQLGLKTIRIPFSLTTQKPSVDLGDIMMELSDHSLNTVQIEDQKPPVVVKKDTIEFNAGSYKTQPNDNVEQLLKKLPGIDVDNTGKITAQGKTVNKILVDGKEFFGNDPQAVMKNLPADAIDKVELIDDKTDRAKNTGIDDGQREKVLNVKLKADKKNGWFGSAALAGGTDDRYLGQLNLNHFDDKKQLSLMLMSNNVNESGVTQVDMGGSSGGGSGINTNHTGGINYSDEWGKKRQFKFNSSLVTTFSSNSITQVSNTMDAPNNLITNQNTTGSNSGSSYRLNLNLLYNIDTLNSLNFIPTLSLSHNNNLSSKTYNSVDSINRFINSGNQVLDQSGNTPSFGGTFTFNHKLKHGNGSINFNTVGNYNANNGSYNNQSITRFIKSGSPVDSAYNQQTTNTNNSINNTTTVSFVRMINKKQGLSFNLSQTYNYTKSNADQATVQYNPVTGRYDIVAPSVSGNYGNENYQYTTALGLNKTDGKATYVLNAELNDLGLKGTFLNANQLNVIKRNDWAITPDASFRYGEMMGKSISVNVSERVAQPSVTDLQPVFNNTDPLYIRQGNPDLKLSNTLSSTVGYNVFDMKKSTYLNAYLSYSQTWNGFSTASVIDPSSGIQTSRPINTNGNFDASAGMTIYKKMKALALIYGFSAHVNRNINSVNNAENAVLRLSPNLNLGLEYDNKGLQIDLRTSTSFNDAQNSVQHLADQKYFSFNNALSVSVKPFKKLRIFSDVNQNAYTAQSNSPGQSVYILNAGIERYFMKNDQLTLSVNGYDLLSQNAGLQRSISQTGQIINNQTNTIGQYFFLKLVFKLNKMGGVKGFSVPITMPY